MGLPLYDSPFLEVELAAASVGPERADLVRRFRRDGFLVLPGFVEDDLVGRLSGRYEWLFDPATEFDVDEDAVHKLRADPNRVHDAWCVSDEVRELAGHAEALGLLSDLFGRKPIPFQTLNFMRGSEQGMHSDAMSFASRPRGFMCAVWVALEDVTLASGALQVAKGSHVFPEVDVSDLGAWAEAESKHSSADFPAYERLVEAQLKLGQTPVETVECKKGTAIIWASNLLHAAAPVLDPKSTRMSQVTHYYFEDCIYYTPRFSDVALGEYCLRNIQDIRTGAPIPQRFNGENLVALEAGHEDRELYRLQRPADALPNGTPNPLVKLQTERALQKEHNRTLEVELEKERAHNQSQALKILYLESILAKIRGHTLYRIRTLLAALIGKGDFHKKQ